MTKIQNFINKAWMAIGGIENEDVHWFLYERPKIIRRDKFFDQYLWAVWVSGLKRKSAEGFLYKCDQKVFDYKFVASDPNGDQVFYYIDWGDGINSGWVGPYASSQEQTVSHTWENKSTYLIKAKTKDVSGAESDWTTLSVTMPQSTALTTLFHHRWFEQFLCTFPILKHLLNQ
jgi:hypothetical protein